MMHNGGLLVACIVVLVAFVCVASSSAEPLASRSELNARSIPVQERPYVRKGAGHASKEHKEQHQKLIEEAKEKEQKQKEEEQDETNANKRLPVSPSPSTSASPSISPSISPSPHPNVSTCTLYLRYHGQPEGILIYNCDGEVIANLTQPHAHKTQVSLDLFTQPGPYRIEWNPFGTGFIYSKEHITCGCSDCESSWYQGGVSAHVYLCKPPPVNPVC